MVFPINPPYRSLAKTVMYAVISHTLTAQAFCDTAVSGDYLKRVARVTDIPGCVAFWDFTKRESSAQGRFTAHIPKGSTNDFALDAGNYIKDFWGEGPEATYADFPLLGRGPFGQAVRIRKESDPHFRPFLFIPRNRLHDSEIDIKGPGKSVSVVVWAIRESGGHALAGIWHEGTDLKEKATANIVRVERGQRQYALFAGLNKEGSACGHVSENGASSFAYKYAMHKSNSGDISPAIDADSAPGLLDASWCAFGMTFDHQTHELKGWLNGRSADRWQDNVQKSMPPIYNAWLQSRLHTIEGTQEGEDPSYPADQWYLPPETECLSTRVLSETQEEKIELREFAYTRLKVFLKKASSGKWEETGRDLSEIRLNPWWFPHGLYIPERETGGPFTIGRVIHSARSVGFTGWIGGVAVFNRAISSDEMLSLNSLATSPPISAPSP